MGSAWTMRRQVCLCSLLHALAPTGASPEFTAEIIEAVAQSPAGFGRPRRSNGAEDDPHECVCDRRCPQCTGSLAQQAEDEPPADMADDPRQREREVDV